jgi:uncharacterized protein (TIGR03382 family)
VKYNTDEGDFEIAASEAPIPGTLALLGIGALLSRRKFLKLS